MDDMEEANIKPLRKSDKAELIELFTRTFRDYLFLFPSLPDKPGKIGAVIKAILDLFGGTKNSFLYGIRKENRIVCASLSIDSQTAPSLLALVMFFFSLLWVLGWHAWRDIEVVYKEKPKYKERYLELEIIGTLPEYQGKGLGRKMLHFLYDKARKENYKGIILVASRDTPAFLLYSKDGFIVEKEFALGDTTLCWMRLVF